MDRIEGQQFKVTFQSMPDTEVREFWFFTRKGAMDLVSKLSGAAFVVLETVKED